MYIYEYEKKQTEYQINMQDGYKTVRFGAGYKDEKCKANETVHLHIFEPKEVKGDILFLHGIGRRNIAYLQWYGRFFARYGYRTTFLILPYHLERSSGLGKDGEPFFSSEPDECTVLFHNTVKDARRSIDFLETQEGFDPTRLFLVGVSFGGMLGAMTMALDKRIKKGCLMITGGNWRWINFYSPYAQDIRQQYLTVSNHYGCRNEETCAKNFRADACAFVKNNFKNINDIFEKSPITCYHYDAISYAPFIAQPVLIINGIFDKIMPKKASQELNSLLKNKKIKQIPSGHKSSILFRRIIALWIMKFFR